MKKFFYMNSFFTKIILAILSFLVIICIFIPYMRIPAIDTVQDIDVNNKVLKRVIGDEQPNFNITEFTHTSMTVFELYKDKELTEVVNKAEIPLYGDESVYYFATYAFGYDINDKDAGLQTILLDVYQLNLLRGASSETPISIKTEIYHDPFVGFEPKDGLSGIIDVTVPRTKVFDLAGIIDSKTAWRIIDENNIYGSFTSDKTLDEPKNMNLPEDPDNKNKSNKQKTPDRINPWVAITLRVNEGNAEVKASYHPLVVYDLQVERDGYKRTLPVVAEIGGSLMPTEQTSKGIAFYEKDAFMFVFMILAAISSILAFTAPSSMRWIESILAIIMGIGLIVIPISDIMFYSKHDFEYDPGCFILIVLGALIVLWAIFDYIRCTSEYKAEKIRIYGADYFSRERKIRMAEERKIKDAEYAERKREEKAALKLAAAEEAAKLKAYKAEQKKNKK